MKNIDIRFKYVFVIWLVVLSVYWYIRSRSEKFMTSAPGTEIIMYKGMEIIKPRLSSADEAQRKKLQAVYDKIKKENAYVKKKMSDAKLNIVNVDKQTAAAIRADKSKLGKMKRKAKDDLAMHKRDYDQKTV